MYGFDETAVSWFGSFLTGRLQKVRIGGSTSITFFVNVMASGGFYSLIYIYIACPFDLDLK